MADTRISQLPLVANPVTTDVIVGDFGSPGATGRTTLSSIFSLLLATNSTGTGVIVRQISPSLTTPNLGAATATSINKVTITQPTTGATITIADGKTLTASNSLNFVGADGSTITFPSTSISVARTSGTNTFTGQQTFGLIISNVANGADGIRLTNSSLTGTKGWEFYPITNGTDTDMVLFEFATVNSGNRMTCKAGGNLQLETGNLLVNAAGNGLRVKEGSNAKQGTATLVGGTATVSNTSVTATSRIFLTSQVDGGTPGWLRVSARSVGTSFTISSSSGTDTSTVAYQIFEPA